MKDKRSFPRTDSGVLAEALRNYKTNQINYIKRKRPDKVDEFMACNTLTKARKIRRGEV